MSAVLVAANENRWWRERHANSINANAWPGSSPGSLTAWSTSFPRRQSGISLIEVMVSVLILSIGLLGIAAMQATALRNGQSSLERSQAVVQSYSILDTIRADRDNVASYTMPKRCAATAAATGATAEQTAPGRRVPHRS